MLKAQQQLADFVAGGRVGGLEFQRALFDWYERNQAAVDAWLLKGDVEEPMFERDPIGYAYMEMPNPETMIGRFMLKLGM